ncbi:hypothetical protein KUCAC02_026747 [Chaenocephalus aceratus]|nr:hypothetical protein KUCAC02_026747 [Chaenocephalus aceratus]
MDSCALELLAMLLFVAAWLCVLASTLLPPAAVANHVHRPTAGGELRAGPVGDLCGAGRGRDGVPGRQQPGPLQRPEAVPYPHVCFTGRGRAGPAGGDAWTPHVSYMAHLAVMHFFDDKVPDVVPRWEFGDALFIGWAGGFLLVVAGLLLVSACWYSPGRGTEPALQRRYQVMSTDVSFKKRSEYV